MVDEELKKMAEENAFLRRTNRRLSEALDEQRDRFEARLHRARVDADERCANIARRLTR